MGQQEPPTQCPQGRLDKSMSPRVAKNYPPPIYPGGTLGVTLDRAITLS